MSKRLIPTSLFGLVLVIGLFSCDATRNVSPLTLAKQHILGKWELLSTMEDDNLDGQMNDAPHDVLPGQNLMYIFYDYGDVKITYASLAPYTWHWNITKNGTLLQISNDYGYTEDRTIDSLSATTLILEKKADTSGNLTWYQFKRP